MHTITRDGYLEAAARLLEVAGVEPEQVTRIECYAGYYSVRYYEGPGEWATRIVHVLDDQSACICPSANGPDADGPDEDCPLHGRESTDTFTGFTKAARS